MRYKEIAQQSSVLFHNFFFFLINNVINWKKKKNTTYTGLILETINHGVEYNNQWNLNEKKKNKNPKKAAKQKEQQ